MNVITLFSRRYRSRSSSQLFRFFTSRQVSENESVRGNLTAAKMSGVLSVLAMIPLGVKGLQVIWILVLSQHLPHLTASKAPNASLLGRRYLSRHHHFHNPLTRSERQLVRWLLTPAAHLRVSDIRDSAG